MSSADSSSRGRHGPARRTLALLRPHRAPVALAVALGIGGVALNAAGPMLLGKATDLVFDGIRHTRGSGGVDFDGIARVLLIALVFFAAASSSPSSRGDWSRPSYSVWSSRCASPWRPSSPACRCGTSTATRQVSCSAG